MARPNGSGAGGAGLLSKVVKFVSNPTKDWKDLDELDVNQDEDLTAQQVRERIERKRRNDFIRKTEFAQLRKIINGRKRQKQPQVLVELAGKPGAAGSESVSPSLAFKSRAGTLQKIDEIEKQMSKQWWQGSGAAAPQENLDSAAEGVAAFLDSHESGPQTDSAFFMSSDSLFFAEAVGRQIASAKEKLAILPQPMAQEDPLVRKLLRMQRMAAYFGLEEEFVHDTDLEDAAILFASARIQDAEKILVNVIRKKVAEPDKKMQKEAWLTLFDLYRATGQQDRFDLVSIDFAKLFGRTAPVWFSMPELLGQARAVPGRKQQFSWICPPDLSTQAIATASALLVRASAPYQLNWTRLKNLPEESLLPLADFINSLAAKPGEIAFTGADQLLGLVRENAVVGKVDGLRSWWALLMAVLRLMGQQESFEMAALDFTVTYEESPPSWTSPVAHYADATDASRSGLGGLPLDVEDDKDSLVLHHAQLSGRIEHDAVESLDQAVVGLPENAPIAIDCERLISIDFPAAGSVLNWAALQQSKGHLVAFTNLHRLVATFFNVVGINEHAKISLRKN